MGKLIKYQIRSLYPFLVLFGLNLLWLLFNIISPKWNLDKGLQSIIELGNFFIILYSIKAFNDELDEEKSILSYQLPVSTFSRVIIKYGIFCIAYILIILLNVVAALYNKEHIYSVMFNELKNSNQYITYVITSRTFGYVSGMMVTICIILMSKCISKKFSVLNYKEIISIVLALLLLIICIAISQEMLKYNLWIDRYNFQPLIKDQLGDIKYEINEYILFFHSFSSLSGSVENIQRHLQAINLLPMIINVAATFILTPIVARLSKNN